MKLKDLKEKLNQFPSELDDAEVLLHSQVGDKEWELVENVEVYTNKVFRVINKSGETHSFTFNKDEYWFVCNKKVTYTDEGKSLNEETVIIIE